MTGWRGYFCGIVSFRQSRYRWSFRPWTTLTKVHETQRLGGSLVTAGGSETPASGLESDHGADLLVPSERDGDHRRPGLDRLARRRLRRVSLATRGRREAGGDRGADRRREHVEPRDRRCRA